MNKIFTLNCDECHIPLIYGIHPLYIPTAGPHLCERCMQSCCATAENFGIKNFPHVKAWSDARKHIGQATLNAINWNGQVYNNLSILNGNAPLNEPLTSYDISVTLFNVRKHG